MPCTVETAAGTAMRNRVGIASASVVTSGLEPWSGRSIEARMESRCLRLPSWYRFKQRIRGVAAVRSISKKIAFVCLLLTVWSAIAFVTHQHSNAAESAKCTVCVAAHSASPKADSTPRPTTFVVVSTFRAEPVFAKQRFVAFALSVRPPPSV